ncbi:hypothetical protein ACQR1Y_11885 [Bradyrhizobium sp. HKCCYLRH3099]
MSTTNDWSETVRLYDVAIERAEFALWALPAFIIAVLVILVVFPGSRREG